MFKKLAENWVLKLLSLAFALVLWFFVMGEQRLERSFSVPLELRNMPVGMMVASDIPNHIAVRISGPRTMLMNLHPEEKGIAVDLKGLRPGLTTFKRLEEQLDLHGPLKVTRLSPPNIDVRLERILSKTVPVQVAWTGDPASGYRIGKILAQPAKVTVEGAKNELDQIQSVSTEKVDISGATEDFAVVVPLKYSGKFSHLKDQTTVEVQIAVERLP